MIQNHPKLVVVYYSIKRELNTRPIYERRCDERLKTKLEESTSLGYTGLLVELEHLKIKTTLIDEMFASVMGEYVFSKTEDPKPRGHCFFFFYTSEELVLGRKAFVLLAGSTVLWTCLLARPWYSS